MPVCLIYIQVFGTYWWLKFCIHYLWSVFIKVLIDILSQVIYTSFMVLVHISSLHKKKSGYVTALETNYWWEEQVLTVYKLKSQNNHKTWR